MPQLSETLPRAGRLQLALHSYTPLRLAQTFAAYVGAFYDRGAFDALARQVSDLYCLESPDQAWLFRSHLDRRLYDRYHAPVTWELSGGEDNAI